MCRVFGYTPPPPMYICEELKSISWVHLFRSLNFFETFALTKLGDHPFCKTSWAGPLWNLLVYVAPPTLGLQMSAIKPCFLCGRWGQERRP